MNKYFIAILTILTCVLYANAQGQSDTTKFKIIEEPAMPDGGYAGLYKYLGKKLKYPKKARKNGIEGKVYVQFVITEDGSVDQYSVKALLKEDIKGSGGSIFKANEMPQNKELNDEAERVIREMPDWSPPMHDGKPTRQRIIMPINFKL